MCLENDSRMTNSKPSVKSETDRNDHDAEEQSPNEKFKSLLRRVVKLKSEEVEEVKRAVPAPTRKKQDQSN